MLVALVGLIALGALAFAGAALREAGRVIWRRWTR